MRRFSMLDDSKPTLSRAIFSHRLHIGLGVVLLGALVVRPQNIFGDHQVFGVTISLALILLGLAMRAWAGGCAGAHTRKATIEAPRLITGGPYAYVRNPIYLASIILGLGMVGLLGDLWMFALYAAVFVFLYTAIVPAEEAFLRRTFPEEFARYCAHVPRLFPKWRPWREAQPVEFEWSAITGEARLGLVLLGIYTFMRLAAWLRAL